MSQSSWFIFPKAGCTPNVSRCAKASISLSNSAQSLSHSAGGVPPRPCSISGRVGTPGGHRTGVRSATHLMNVRCSRLVAGLAYFSPMATRNESLRWHTIWGAVMRPHLARASVWRQATRLWHAARTFGSASVPINCYFDSGRVMRFWITKNSELPVREQLVRQVLLGILSEDLPSGHKLPSVRAVARRHQIHSNTVSAAYHDLLEQGWLEWRRGSGLYVRPLQASGDGQLDQLLTGVLQAARRQNYEPEEVLHRLEPMLHPVPYQRILIAETEPAMREILQAELTESLSVPIDAALNLAEIAAGGRSLVVALPTRAAKYGGNCRAGFPALPSACVPCEPPSKDKPSPRPIR